MGNLETILAGISTLQKFMPVVEAVGAEIGPLVKTELADGKVVWDALVKAFQDFKTAVETVKASASK